MSKYIGLEGMELRMTNRNRELDFERRELRRKRRKKNQIISYVSVIIVLLLVLTGLYFGIGTISDYMNIKKQEQAAAQEPAPQEEEPIQEDSTPVESVVVEEEDLLGDLVNSTISEMTVEEKVAGLFMVTPESLTNVDTVIQAGESTKAALEKYPVGGLIYFAKNIKSEEQIKEMLKNSAAYNKFPVFLGVDEEGGDIARIGNSGINVAKVENMSVIGETGDSKKAYDAGATIGGYLAYYGFNVDFAPVADILTNEENTFLRGRSFGSDTALVSDMSTEFLKGLQEQKVSGALKHFPGHGNTKEDSHEIMPVTNKTLEEIRSTEFVPFQKGIEAGADFVLVGHIAAPEVTGDETPATLSSVIVTDILKKELGFNGVVITDAMNMGAIATQYDTKEASVKAIQAGIDMILMPENFIESYDAVLAAVQDGTIPMERVDDALSRIYHIKYKDALSDTPTDTEEIQQ